MEKIKHNWDKNKIINMINNQSGRWTIFKNLNKSDYNEFIKLNKEVEVGNNLLAKLVCSEYYQVADEIHNKFTWEIKAEIKLKRRD